jgi:transcriptional regulator with XRE-family HTH domain
MSIQAAKFYTAFGALVRQRRLKLGLTQDELGKRVGLSRTSMTNIELGHQKILLHQLFKIAEALRVEAAELLPSFDDTKSISAIEKKLPDSLSHDEKELFRKVVRSQAPIRNQR